MMFEMLTRSIFDQFLNDDFFHGIIHQLVYVVHQQPTTSNINKIVQKFLLIMLHQHQNIEMISNDHHHHQHVLIQR